MRYEDASQTGTAGSDVNARDDADHLAANDFGPATGNAITGAGTITGATGTDSGGQIIAIQGAGGSDTSIADGSLEIAGQYGTLTIDAAGNYSYARNPGTPEGVSDTFTYTLANEAGTTDTANLVINIGDLPILQAEGTQTIQTNDGVVVLPAGVELSDVRVVGRDLVITLPDGSTMVIPDGAVFVPQLVIDGVEVPASNLAALLIDSEPKPAAGDLSSAQQSSGGNFGLPPGPLDPGVPLGDLLPPTELDYTPPEFEDPGIEPEDEDPTIVIQPDGQPASVAAVDSVDEKGLPARPVGEPAGSGEIADGNGGNNSDTTETTTGTIIVNSPDEPNSISITVNGTTTVISSVGQVFVGQFGDLTITSISDTAIGYSYTLRDNTSGNDTHDDFLVSVTDNDGDVAAATLRIDIIDDVPTARPDIDTLGVGEFVATGNVMTDAAPGDAGDPDTNAADTVGADNARVTFIDSVDAAPGATVPDGNFVDIAGQYGTLRIFSNGDYTYTRGENSPGGVQDVFNYTLTDGDGDTSTTTLTINIPDTPITVQFSIGNVLDDDAQPGGIPGGPEDDGGGSFIEGDINANGGDGGLTFTLRDTGAPDGFTYELDVDGNLLIKQDGNLVLTVTLDSATGHWTITQNAPIDHPTLNGQPGDDTENNVDFGITVRATDADGDFIEGTGLLSVDDDTPVAALNLEAELGTIVLDETRDEGTDTPDGTDPPGKESGTIDFSTKFNEPAYGADGPGSTTYTLILSEDGIGSGLYALEAGDTDDGGDGDGYGQGNEITLSINEAGTIITGSAGEVDYFTIEINASTGVVTFTQLNPIWHPDLTESFDETATLNTEAANDIIVRQTVTDSDGDSDTADANVGQGVFAIQDDGPDAYDPCPDDVISINDPDADPFTGNLNLPDVGEDKPGVVTFGVADGDPVLDKEGNPVTSGEDELFYFINDEGVLEARVGDENGELIFTITLNDDGTTFTYDQIGAIGSGGTTEFKDFDQADAGNTNYLGLGNDDPASAVDLLMSAGENTDADADIEDTTVNTDSDSIGAQNQSMNADDSEVLRLDFVSNLQTGGVGPTGFTFDGHVPTTSYLQTIPQVQGSQEAVAAFKVWALDSTLTDAAAPDRNPTDGFSDADTVTITQVTIIDWETGDTDVEDISGLANGDTLALDFGVSVTRNADGSVSFSGIQEGDQYGVATGGNEFNAIAVQATGHSFDLGVFSIGTVSDFEPVDLEVPIVLTDADGDPVTCEIDIHIGVPLVVSDATVTVNEAGLPGIGSDAGSDSEIDTGTLVPSGGTGPYTFTLLSNANGQFGNLVLDPNTGEYTYTLDTPFDSQPDADDGTNPELGAESFDVQVTDSLGATHTLTITVNIIDDVPTAVDDTDTIESGSNDPATGNVITDAAPGDAGDSDDGADTMGADQPANVTAITFDGTTVVVPNGGSAEIPGDNGTLTIFANGDYSYERADGSPGEAQDVFTYTITDADGDTAQANLTITIEDAGVTVNIPTGEAETTVYENALGTAPQGTSEAAAPGANDDPNEVVTGTITFNALDGLGSITIGTTTLNLAGAYPQTVADDATGKLEVTGVTYDPATGDGTVSYKYTLEDNTLGNQAVNGGNTTVSFDVDIVDGDGDHSPDSDLVITIVDDAPIAADDSNSVSEGGSVNGTVLTNDLSGADGYGANKVVGGVLGNNDAADSTNIVGTQIVIDGTYGTLTLNTDGTYTYDADANTNPAPGAKDEFVYTIRDADGDVDSAVLTINLSDVNLPADNQNKVVNEAALDLNDDGSDLAAGSVTGSNPSSTAETVSGTLNVPGAASYAIVGSSTGTHGIIQINSNGTYTYTLTDPVDGPTADNGTNTFDNVETFTYEADDGNGNTVQGTITIDVIDDVPTAHSNVNSVSEGATANGNVLTDATDDVFGADGAAAGGGVTGVATGSNTASPVAGGTGAPLVGTYGTLTLNANGTYTYEANPDVINSGSVVDHFVYTITDGDGDTSTTTLDITVNNVTVTAIDTDALVNEAGLPVIGSNPGATSEIDSDGSITPSGGTGPYTYELTSSANGAFGNLVLNANGTYTYTLDTPFDTSPDANNGTNIEDNRDSFTYKVTDANGNTTTGTIDVDIVDDVPTATVSTAGFSISHDETAGLQDTDVAGPIAAFAGVSNPGDDPDVAGAVIGYAAGAGAISSTGTIFGADGAAALNPSVFSLDVSAAGVDSGLNVTGGQDILLTKEGALIIGRVSGGPLDGKAAFAVSIDPASGQISMVQYLSIQHLNTGSTDESLSINNGAILAVATVKDGDGDTDSGSTGIGNLISFQDDGPTAVSAAAITSGLSNGGGDSASANLDGGGNNIVSDNMGADGGKVIFTSATTAALTAANLKHNGTALEYAITGGDQLLTAFVDTNNNNTVDGGETVFTIQLQTGVGGNNYTVTMVQSVDVVQNIDFNGGGYNFVGGNGSWAGFTSGTNGDGVLDLLLTPMVNGANASTMNTNANEGGVGSGNSVAVGEGVRVDTLQDLQAVPAPTPSGDYSSGANQNHVFGQHENVIGISAVISTVNGPPGSTTDIRMVARDEGAGSDANDLVGDGTIEAITTVVITHGAVTTTVLKTNGLDQDVIVDGHTYNVVFGATDATVNDVIVNTRLGASTADGFDSLEFRNVGGQEFKIGDFNTLAISNGPLDMTVPISVVDGDGDTVASGNLAIHIDGSAPPLVLDTSGDGSLAFVDHSAGVSYDYNGDGLAESTAWVGGGDSILVRDANGDGTVTDASEFVFGGNGVTDMEALAGQYGATLDANDADFGQFKVWTDANMNGVADAGELQSLSDAGITSIGLVSDGISYTAANGEVLVAGSGTFTMADGSTGVSADAAFVTGGVSDGKSMQEVERIAANSNSVTLAAAVAAAGIAAGTPAAANGFGDAEFSAITNAVVARESFADSGLEGAQDGRTFDLGNAWDAGFTASFQDLSGSSHTAIASANIGELGAHLSLGGGLNSLLEATDFGAMLNMPALDMSAAMTVAAPSLASLMPQGSAINGQITGSVEQIVADALNGGGSAPSIDALLSALPGAGLGENGGLQGLATQIGDNVPTWDTGHSGGFTFDAAMIITSEAMVLHHDAMQPVANG